MSTHLIKVSNFRRVTKNSYCSSNPGVLPDGRVHMLISPTGTREVWLVVVSQAAPALFGQRHLPGLPL